MNNKETITKLEELAGCCNYEIVIEPEDVEALNTAIKALKNGRPKGKWIKTNDYVTCAYGCIDYVKCSCCKNDSLEDGDYCPNCGADMREVDDER